MKNSIQLQIIAEHVPELAEHISNIKPDERESLGNLIHSKTQEVGGVASVGVIYPLEVIAILGGSSMRFFKSRKK